MARTKLYRSENGERITLCTAVIYVKDSGKWRETTKTEMQILEIQNEMTASDPPLTISIYLPYPGSGQDGDYYGLIYPTGWDGPVWDDTQ